MSIEPLRAGLDDALRSWAAPARARMPRAQFCAATHPFDDATLCCRLSGHLGPHSADGGDPWSDEGPLPRTGGWLT